LPSLTDLVDRVRRYHPGADVELIRRAWLFSEWAHREQVRKSGEPYFVHPSRVAGIIADLKLDAASVCAGLLHDVVEDTTTTVEELARDFGDEVAALVDGVTKLGQINFTSREDRQAENFRKMVVAMAKDLRVLLIKLCDRLDNMRSLQFMKPESQERIARETLDIYAPLANRLGIQTLKAELEDLAFQFLEPHAYEQLTQQVATTESGRQSYIDSVCRTIANVLAEQGFVAEVSGRAKHLYSIHRKMTEQHCTFDQVYDLIAFRICVDSIADCYAVLGVAHSHWTPIPGRFRDYIALPKPNMYQSLHTAVIGPGRQRIEIQIRTHEMHRVAEFGIAAHWKYKERLSGGVDPKDAERFGWLRELADYQQSLKDPVEFVESVKIDLFPDEVYVFTPKGDVRVFPRGATPIDFAYGIHSEVGHHCSGARVNGQIVPLRYKLKNGDVVEVMTSPNQQPNKEWVDFCATTRARTRIRNFLRAEQRQKGINLGRELLESDMRAAGMSLSKFLKNQREMDRVCEQLKQPTADELLLAVGYGRLHTDDVIDALSKRDGAAGDSERPEAAPPSELRTGMLSQLVDRVTGGDKSGIKVNGVDDVLVRYAKCCNPLPGDPIIGFITRGRGVTIHRRQCAKAFDSDPERRIEVTWDAKAKINRPVRIQVTTNNTPGILGIVSQIFSAQRLNISEANCRAQEDGRACNVFTFHVEELKQLKVVMRELGKVEGVVAVERV